MRSTLDLAPAGWYVDPSGRFDSRWWDGRAWDRHVAKYGITFEVTFREPDADHWAPMIALRPS